MNLSRESLESALVGLVKALDLRSKIIFKIILETSCKVSKIPKIKVKDISEKGIRFTKITVPISLQLYQLILDFIQENDLSSDSFLFATRQSDSITAKRVRQIIQKISKEKLGFKLDPKDLRQYSISAKLKTKKVEEVKKEAGLKRLDKRNYLSERQIRNIESHIQDKRTSLIFRLLLKNVKSSKIVNLKVEDILGLKIPERLVRDLESYASSNQVTFGEYLFKTRQDTHLSKVMIFKIMTGLGKKVGMKVNPQILNNTCIANAVFSNDSESRLNALGVKTRAFALHGGFVKNE
jgi:integrase